MPRQSSKSPNTVAPEPDMRARRQPALRASAPAPRRSPARARSPAASRSLRAARRWPRGAAAGRALGSIAGWRRGCPALSGAPSAWNTAAVSTGTPGLTSTAKSGGRRKAGPSTSPAPAIIRARDSRQTGTSAPVSRAAAQDRRIVERQVVEAGEKPQRRGGVGRAAAEAGRDRQALRQMEGARAQARGRAARARGPP